MPTAVHSGEASLLCLQASRRKVVFVKIMIQHANSCADGEASLLCLQALMRKVVFVKIMIKSEESTSAVVQRLCWLL